MTMCPSCQEFELDYRGLCPTCSISLASMAVNNIEPDSAEAYIRKTTEAARRTRERATSEPRSVNKVPIARDLELRFLELARRHGASSVVTCSMLSYTRVTAFRKKTVALPKPIVSGHLKGWIVEQGTASIYDSPVGVLLDQGGRYWNVHQWGPGGWKTSAREIINQPDKTKYLEYFARMVAQWRHSQ